MATGIGHYFVFDHEEEMWICSGCDTYKGSKASLEPCPAYEKIKHQPGKEPCPHCEPGEL